MLSQDILQHTLMHTLPEKPREKINIILQGQPHPDAPITSHSALAWTTFTTPVVFLLYDDTPLRKPLTIFIQQKQHALSQLNYHESLQDLVLVWNHCVVVDSATPASLFYGQEGWKWNQGVVRNEQGSVQVTLFVYTRDAWIHVKQAKRAKHLALLQEDHPDTPLVSLPITTNTQKQMEEDEDRIQVTFQHGSTHTLARIPKVNLLSFYLV